jgi:hypothetical protein
MNWMAYNVAHDVVLPGSNHGRMPFFMYPQGETDNGRLNPFDPANVKYRITAREVS